MNKTLPIRKPVQAGDYGKPSVIKKDNDKKTDVKNTDGRKVLALWGN